MNVKFLLQFSEKSLCEVPDGIAAFIAIKDKKPEIKVKFDLKVSKDGSNKNFFEVKLIFGVNSSVEEKNVYIVELVYSALVQIDESEDNPFSERKIKRMLMVDAPKFLFPFARAEIANLVRSAGFMNLMLENIDFEALFKKHQEEEGEDSDDENEDLKD